MCGDYYIGGRRFSSLSDLIGYYSYVSCLLKGEKLLSPVAPPEVRWAYRIHKYQAAYNRFKHSVTAYTFSYVRQFCIVLKSHKDMCVR